MKNILNYYYSFNTYEVYSLENKYYFNYNGISYIFLPYERPLSDLKSIYNYYNEIKKRGIFVNDIVLNKYNQIVTLINNIPYILIKDNTKKKNIDMNDILYVQNNTVNIINDKNLYRNDWVDMWQSKIDYYEKQMNNFSNKFPLLKKTIDYYIGLSENAISYIIYNNSSINNLVLSHKRLSYNDSTFDFYNPVNFIIDNRIRDFSEYIKSLFFQEKITSEVFNNYLNYMNYTKEEYVFLIARLLFPSYYFDLYDEIINEKKEENEIKNVLNKNNDYILFLKNTFYYIIYVKKINIPYIDWIFRYQNL